MNNLAYLIVAYLMSEKIELESEFDYAVPCQTIKWISHEISDNPVKYQITVYEDNIRYSKEYSSGYSSSGEIKTFDDFKQMFRY
jgi:hypothetical protein